MAAQIRYSTVVYIDKTLCNDVSAHNGALQGLKNLHGLVTLINQHDGYFNSDLLS